MAELKTLDGAFNQLTVTQDRSRAARRPIAACQHQRRPTKKRSPPGRREPRTYYFYLTPEYDEEGSGAFDVRERSIYTETHPPCSTQKNFLQLNRQRYLEWVSQRYWLAMLASDQYHATQEQHIMDMPRKAIHLGILSGDYKR